MHRVRPDLPNKQEEIHMQYTAVEQFFYLHHNTSVRILYSNREDVALFLLLIIFFLEKAYRDWNVDLHVYGS